MRLLGHKTLQRNVCWTSAPGSKSCQAYYVPPLFPVDWNMFLAFIQHSNAHHMVVGGCFLKGRLLISRILFISAFDVQAV